MRIRPTGSQAKKIYWRGYGRWWSALQVGPSAVHIPRTKRTQNPFPPRLSQATSTREGAKHRSRRCAQTHKTGARGTHKEATCPSARLVTRASNFARATWWRMRIGRSDSLPALARARGTIISERATRPKVEKGERGARTPITETAGFTSLLAHCSRHGSALATARHRARHRERATSESATERTSTVASERRRERAQRAAARASCSQRARSRAGGRSRRTLRAERRHRPPARWRRLRRRHQR